MAKPQNPGAAARWRLNRDGRLTTAWRHPDFRALWLATVANQVGLGMQQVLLGWLILHLTGAVGLVGVIYAAHSAPNLIVGFAAGAVTDRLDRRAVMRLAVWGMMAAALAVAALLLSNALQVWQLLAAAFILGILNAFYMTARQTYVYDIVGGAGAANGIALIILAQRVGGVFGALLVGGIIQWQGPGVSFLVMAASYGGGAAALHCLKRRGEAAPSQREPMLQNLVNYFRALRSNRVMLSLMFSTAGVEILGFSHQVMLPILAENVLHIGPAGLGALTAARFGGGAVGVLGLTALGDVKRKGWLLLGALLLFGAGIIGLSLATVFWVAFLLVALVNVMASATDVLHTVLMQLCVSNEQRGRAMGSWIVGIGTAPVGQLEIGNLAALTTAKVALMTNGAALIALAVIMAAALPRLRRL